MNIIPKTKEKIEGKIKYNFEGGNLSSDSGLIIFKKFIDEFGLKNLVQENMNFSDRNFICFFQRLYLRMAGYNNDLVLKDLKLDPIFQKMLNISDLYSQSTMSRFDNDLDEVDLQSFDKLNFSLLEKSYKKDLPERVILDIDSTGIRTFGNQNKQAYNGHYKENGYHPLMVFDGITGDLIKAELRPGNVYTSNGVVEFITPVIEWYKKNFPEIELHFRGDSGFAIPELYELLEKHNIEYGIRLKSNNILKQLTKSPENYFSKKELSDGSVHLVKFDNFDYKAGSWKKERSVKVKIEKKAGTLIPRITYIVTNKKDNTKEILNYYTDRGKMENFIKEIKNGFGLKNLSHKEFIVNQNKLAQLMIIYNINNLMRRLVFPKEFAKYRIETIRYKFIKIASKSVKSGRVHTFKMSSSYPYKKEFLEIISNIEKISVA